MMMQKVEGRDKNLTLQLLKYLHHSVQLMRPGIGQNASYTVGDFINRPFIKRRCGSLHDCSYI